MQSGSNKKRQEKDKQIGPSWPFTLPTKGVETDRPLRLWTGVCQRYESLRRCVCTYWMWSHLCKATGKKTGKKRGGNIQPIQRQMINPTRQFTLSSHQINLTWMKNPYLYL